MPEDTNKFIIIVDDDPSIVSLITDYLSRLGYRSKGFYSSQGLFEFISEETPDLIILDVMMPDMDGFQICRKLKSKENLSDIPVIILSGKSDSNDKIFGLEIGADDYISKPFSLEELAARIKAVLRRPWLGSGNRVIRINDSIEIDLQKYQVTVYGEKIELTHSEFKILELLASRRGQVFSRDRILEYLWGEGKIVVERTIDVHIRHLREKLGKAGNLIQNVRGVGYKLAE